MNNYDPQKIEVKWQKIWEENKYGIADDSSDKPKHYHLVEFPYPSGEGLHVGHCMGYGASDAYCRMKRMQGFNVMYPIGWDAFGLPTENYAIKTGKKPALVTKENTDNFRTQMKSLGYAFDWDREVNTTDPNYYKWTQWIFLQFYRHAIIDGKLVEVADNDTTTPRLAYQAEMPINWCPSCKIGLANEEVIAGKCERCGSETVKKMQKQWMLRITAYAERLIKDLDTVEYLDKIKTQQVNWIGRSEGAEIDFKVVIASEAKQSLGDEKIATSLSAPRNDIVKVFTTRADTLFGCTYVVLSPEHPLIKNYESRIKNYEQVLGYIESAKTKSDLERTELQKEKTGVKLEGIKATNPINNEEIDIWVADYVLATYGTGAVMAVPAHDERDFEFAKKYNIPVKQVVAKLYTTNSGQDAVREDKETIKRKSIIAIVKHWEKDQIYCLDWQKLGWKSFIIGGVETDESSEEAAKREVIEESGYQNIKSAEKIGFETHSNFFAGHKDVNRYGMADCYYVELSDGEYVEPELEHTKNHIGEWIDSDKVKEYVNLGNNIEYWDVHQNGERSFTDYGILTNSGEFSDLTSEEAKKKITEKLKSIGAGDFSVNFKLRDWVFSRQHYWGEPIPIIHCNPPAGGCGMVPLDEKDLPLTLPDVKKYEPTNTGESPLADISDWVNVKCPKCGGDAKRETDTMPNWAGSSWYFLAYAMNADNRMQITDNSENIFLRNKDELNYWLPVDIYNGGMEHTTLHLLYSRFWHKFLYDLGKVPTLEPYQKRIAHGIILGPDGQKMSKSRGNVINPDSIVEQFGADTLRAYIMFIGPYDQESAWSTSGVQGVSRFLKRVWNNFSLIKDDASDSKALLVKLNQTIKGISEDIDSYRFNTVISKLMELNNVIEKEKAISKKSFLIFLQLLYPVVPHLVSELYEQLVKSDISKEEWPKPDVKYLKNDTIEIVVQVNGKVRDKITVDSEINDAKLKETALNSEKVKQHIAGHDILKTIVVPKKLVSIVVK